MNINPVTWSLGAKLGGVGVIAVILAGAATTAVVKTGSTEPGVATYLCYNGPAAETRFCCSGMSRAEC